jgi:hypothetical protein
MLICGLICGLIRWLIRGLSGLMVSLLRMRCLLMGSCSWPGG